MKLYILIYVMEMWKTKSNKPELDRHIVCMIYSYENWSIFYGFYYLTLDNDHEEIIKHGEHWMWFDDDSIKYWCYYDEFINFLKTTL